MSGSLVADILGGVVDVLVRLAETGGGDALVRNSLSGHVRWGCDVQFGWVGVQGVVIEIDASCFVMSG